MQDSSARPAETWWPCCTSILACYAASPARPPQCGACWTFATVGAVEASYAIATNTLVNLSEQQLLDCTPIPRGENPANKCHARRVGCRHRS
jgi:hypothetical protein